MFAFLLLLFERWKRNLGLARMNISISDFRYFFV
jgi:hypothetical protein